jgi:predicted nuclease with RNAse H fold
LRYLLRSLGITGPLKKIEEQLGVRRPEELKEINGRIATILWSRFKKGDDQALEKLVLYNIYDVVNLQAIMHLCYQQKVKELKIKINSEKINQKTASSRLEACLSADMACPTNQTEHFTLFDDLPSFNVPKIITRYSHDRVMEAYLNDELLYKINQSKIKSMGLRIEVLIQKIKNKNFLPRVVGIDLSGSEKRDSGFCTLDGEKAFLDLVKTDEEIILKTINAEPAVISIDSPLGLPKGRCCVDDSCACRKYGITRECERTLKKRGINVYPCLIKSMQKLTVRGIKLANYFREIGYEVIESYPGAAQDILGIPRKRIDLPELETDLRDIGIKPCAKSEAITHDEIDALVCALVGFFYLAESYEALGNEEEGYLSLPVFENEG